MYQQLQQLKQLVLEGGFDEESKKDVQSLDSQLSEAARIENLSQDPVIKPYISYLQAEIDRCETLLKTDKTLTDRQRDELFARIEIADKFTSIFAAASKRREELESTINELLHVAQNR